MIDPLLLRELKAFLCGEFADFTVEDEAGKSWIMAIVEGYLPPKRSATDETYEKFMIQLRYSDGEADFFTAEDQAKAINRITIAVRTSSKNVEIGMQNTVNVMAKIQQVIYSHPIIARRYRATFPMKWTAPKADAYPFWEGEMTIPFIVPMVQELYDMGLQIGGDNFG